MQASPKSYRVGILLYSKIETKRNKAKQNKTKQKQQQKTHTFCQISKIRVGRIWTNKQLFFFLALHKPPSYDAPLFSEVHFSTIFYLVVCAFGYRLCETCQRSKPDREKILNEKICD